MADDAHRLKVLTMPSTFDTREHQIAAASMSTQTIHAASIRPCIRLNREDMTFACAEGKIVDQHETGLCWLEAGLSLLSSLALRQGYTIRFSACYLAFFDKLDKARCFLKLVLTDVDARTMWHWLHDGPIQDGGTWEMFLYLVRSYGLVGYADMPPTYQAKHTSQLNTYLNRYLRSVAPAFRDGKLLEETIMGHVYDALLRTYGPPPKTVQLNQKTHSIRLVDVPTRVPSLLQDDWAYTVLAHAPDRPLGRYHGPFFNNPDDATHDEFVCVPFETLVASVVAQLEVQEPVWFTADVRYDFSASRGMAEQNLHDIDKLLNLQFRDQYSKADRMRLHNTAPVHAMLLTGVNVTDGSITRWRVQNSWGKAKKLGEGFVTVSHGWFKEHVFQVAVKTGRIRGTMPDMTVPPKRLDAWDIFGTVAG